MRKLFVFAGVFLGATCSAFAQCGGQERWAVKDGTDSSAGQVDFTNVQTMTIADLVSMKHPRIPGRGDNTTRLVPSETNVVKLQAHLIQWKAETDSDYHLVLTDDTLDFTQGKTATGHSVIGEIPDPNCLSGSHDEFGTSSPFLSIGDGSTGISAARAQLENQFPNADLSGGWNDAGGMMVEIVGVTFFDPPHGQTGRAPNSLEIHPIVSIKFLDNGAQPGGAGLMAAKPAKGKAATPAKPAPASTGIQDPQTGGTAMVTEDRALVVTPSDQSGKSGALRPGVPSADLGFPKTLTVCWFAATGPGAIQISLDGKHWFDVEGTTGSGCKAVPPARFAKLTANKGMYQVSY